MSLLTPKPGRFRNLIGGAWVAGQAAAANVNPSDLDDEIGEYDQADASQATQAVAAAHDAGPGWADATIQTRCDVLDAAGSQMLQRADELGTLLAREEGKLLREGIAEVRRAGQIFKFFAGECIRTPGEKISSVRAGIDVEVTREPVGVVTVITPWNFPIAIPAWKIAPALAFGNTVVFKPAEPVPGSAWALADILHRSGVPAGVVNLVMGRGSVVGDALVGDPRVAAVTFTGSDTVGRRIAQQVTARLGKCQLEMGGKNPLVVLDDADLNAAVNIAVDGAYFSTGQRCTASSRLIVTAGIHDAFVSALVNRLSTLRVGHALDAGSEMGPVVNESQLAGDLEYLEIGKREGARVAFGGEVLQRSTRGHYLQPTLFVDATPSMRIAREEIFGPVACVIQAATYEEALSIANDSSYGLSSGIVTSSLKYATHFKKRSQAGMVMVNAPTAGVDYHVPFGGRRGSSYGPREQGRQAAEFFTSMKTAYTRADTESR